MKVHMGGVAAAIEAFRAAPTPNLIVIELVPTARSLIANLETLSEFCDSGTKVVVVGHENDIALYRAADRARRQRLYRGAVRGAGLHSARVASLQRRPNAETLGRVIAVVGAKGGVGASNISHNLAWSISRVLEIQTRRRRSRSRLRHGGPRFQPGSAPGHRRGGVLAGARRRQPRRPSAVEMQRHAQPARGARDAGSPLRSAGVRLRSAARHSARLDALHGARHAASMDGLDAPHSDQRRRRGDRRQSRSRQSAQRQDAGRRAAFRAAQRSSSEAAAQ